MLNVSLLAYLRVTVRAVRLCVPKTYDFWVRYVPRRKLLKIRPTLSSLLRGFFETAL